MLVEKFYFQKTNFIQIKIYYKINLNKLYSKKEMS